MILTFNYLGQYGRFGNQLFQIAATIGIARKHNLSFQFPEWKYSNRLISALPGPTNNPHISRTYQEGGNPEYREIDLSSVCSGVGWLNIHGYFQDERYFAANRDDVRNALAFKPCDTVDPNSCAIHVRRTDYANQTNKVVYQQLGESRYYHNAMSRFSEDTKFYVFSDNLDYCKEHSAFKDRKNVSYFDSGDEVTDFVSMSMCRHKIIANSSYSWWAAWLGEPAGGKIIAPDSWFGDRMKQWSNWNKSIVPSRWEKVSK